MANIPPQPSVTAAIRNVVDCAWCGRWFENVVDLLCHVEDEHLREDRRVANDPAD